MQFDYEKLRNEIQTNKGLLVQIKKRKMPDKKGMARLALEKLEEEQGKLTKDYVQENFNALLKKLIPLEYSLYREFETDLIQKSLEIFLYEEFERSAEYPELQRFFSEMKKRFNTYTPDRFKEFMGEVTTRLYPVINLIGTSAAQAAKSRAGGSLENHLENLFRKLDFKFETQVLIEGAKIDFLFPNLATYKQQPGNCLFLAAQTTLKDRFRLSLSKITTRSNVRKYIVTATGAGVITSKDWQDLTEGKIGEIGEKGFQVIVFDEVKERFKKNQRNKKETVFSKVYS